MQGLRSSAVSRTVAAAALLAAASGSAPVAAHGGGLDRNGCHHNRRTGDYHCHRNGPGIPVAPRFFSAPAAPPVIRVPRATPDAASGLVRRVQAGLIRLGYNLPAPDNVMGPLTQFAIMKFQEAEGLTIDGAASEILLNLIEAKAAAKGL
jgi:hypothetical protein